MLTPQTELPVYHRGVSTLIERLEEVRKAREWSEREWCERASLSHGTISFFRRRLKDDPAASMNRASLDALAKAADVNIKWLRTGQGPRDVGDTGAGSSGLAVTRPGEVRLRLVGGKPPSATFGGLAEWQSLETTARRLRPLHPEWVWARLADAPLFLGIEPDAETVAAVADLIRWKGEPPREGEDEGPAH